MKWRDGFKMGIRWEKQPVWVVNIRDMRAEKGVFLAESGVK